MIPSQVRRGQRLLLDAGVGGVTPVKVLRTYDQKADVALLRSSTGAWLTVPVSMLSRSTSRQESAKVVSPDVTTQEET